MIWLPKTFVEHHTFTLEKQLGSIDASIPRKLRKRKKFWIFDFSEPDFMVAMGSEKPL